MKQAFLMSLAMLAANIPSSSAQVTNFSVSIAGGYSLLANPLSAGVTNGANEIMPIIDGELIYLWTGTKFNQTGYDAGFGGWVGEDGATPSVPPSLPPGTGFFFFNPGPPTNVTFTGQIAVSPGTTNSINLPSGYSLLGSVLPVSVTNITAAPVKLPIIDGMQVLLWTNAYNYWSYDSGFGGWIGADFKPRTGPAYTVGQGFFYFNPGPPTTWEQSLP